MFLQKQRNYNDVGEIKKYVFAYNGNKKGWSYSKRIKVLYLDIKVVFNNNSSIDLNTEKKIKSYI